MAEEEIPEEETQEETPKETPAGYSPLDNSQYIHTTYANTCHIVVNSSDVFLYFGSRPDGLSDVSWQFDNKIILSHANFMDMVELFASRYYVIQEVYGGRPKTFNDFPPEVREAAWQRVIGITKTVIKGEGEEEDGEENDGSTDEQIEK